MKRATNVFIVGSIPCSRSFDPPAFVPSRFGSPIDRREP
jgi:hypothetical protein